MTVLIVGPQSYIAEKISERLRVEGQTFYLASLREDPGLVYKQKEYIGSAADLSLDCVSEKGIDCAILCTSLDAARAEIYPDEAKNLSCVKNIRLVNKLIDYGVSRFLYLSTIKVYGEELSGEIDEESQVRPASTYAETHLETEDRLRILASKKAREVLILRLSNVFGAPSRPDHSGWKLAANDFAKQLVTKDAIEVRSPGIVRNILPITFLVDVVMGWVSGSMKGRGTQTLNVGSELCISMNALKGLVTDVNERVCRHEDEASIMRSVNNVKRCSKFRYSSDTIRRLGGWSLGVDSAYVASELVSLLKEARKQFPRG